VRAPRNTQQWREDARFTPPLRLDLAGGEGRVVNDAYALAHTTRWQDGPRFWNPILRRGTKRYEGLALGGPVLAVGVRAGEGASLQAATVAGGTKESYLAKQRRDRLLKRLLGGALLLAGLVALGVVLGSAREKSEAA
jgi:hypothetical protein